MCDECWAQRVPQGNPHRLKERTEERCCFCGTATKAGIYVRQTPDSLDCQGKHE